MSDRTTKRLKSGFTTGTAAAAAAKCAFLHLLKGSPPDAVRIPFLSRGAVTIAPNQCTLNEPGRQATCTVIKDAGDDPDITHKATIGAIVTLAADPPGKITIDGGRGVGRVTKPGLAVPKGEAAINPGPITMITRAIEEVQELYQTRWAVNVTVFVPDGEVLAQKTLNARLGIKGGISILGTTGIVHPMSHEAYRATLRSAISVAQAAGVREIVLLTGRKSERFAQDCLPDYPEEAFVRMGDFFKEAMTAVCAAGFKSVRLAVFFGKAVKMAQGLPNTHAAKSDLSLAKLSGWAFADFKDEALRRQIKSANTARHAFDVIRKSCPQLIARVGERMLQAAEQFGDGEIRIIGMLFDYQGKVVYSSEGSYARD